MSGGDRLHQAIQRSGPHKKSHKVEGRIGTHKLFIRGEGSRTQLGYLPVEVEGDHRHRSQVKATSLMTFRP